MSKFLSERPWKELVDKHKLKDPGLLKLLTAYKRVDPAKDAGTAEKLLGGIEAMAAKVRKLAAKNKVVVAHLDALIKDAKKAQQAVKAQIVAAAKANAKAKDDDAADEDGGDEMMSPDALAASLLRVKTGKGARSHAAMVCLAKPFVALLVAPKPTQRLAGPHRSMLKKQSGGTKVLVGRCSWEDGQLVFVLDAAPQGIAKKIKLAVRETTGLAWRVRARSLDGAEDVDVDEDTEADADGAAAAAPTAVSAAAGAEPGPAVTGSDEASVLPSALVDPVRTLVDKLKNSSLGEYVEDKVEELEAELKNVEKQVLEGGAQVANALLAAIKGGVKTAAKHASGVAAFEKDVAKARKLLEALKKHAGKDHVKDEIRQIDRDLRDASALAKAGKLSDAKKKLTSAVKTATAAKGFADKFQAYLKERVAAMTLIHDMDGLYADDGYISDRRTDVTDADALAAPPTRNYAGATTAVRQVSTTMGGHLNDWYSRDAKKDIAALKKLPGAKFVAAEIKEIEAAQVAIDKHLKAKDWRRVVLAGRPMSGLIGAAQKSATRRLAFDAQRPKTVAALAKVKAFKSLTTRHDALAAELKQADEQATQSSHQFEVGLEALKRIEATCNELAARGPDADAFAGERAKADALLATLRKHKAADSQKALLDSIALQLTRAGELAKDPARSKEALDEQRAAAKELAAAQTALDEAASVSTITDGAKGAAGVQKAVEKLELEATACEKSKHKAVVAKELKGLRKALDVAKTLAAKKNEKKALEALKIAGERLIAIKSVLAQQDGYAERHAAFEKRLATIGKAKEAASVKARVDAAKKALADVAKQHAAHAWDARAKALGTLEDALDAAEKAVADRRKFDAAQKQLDADIKATTLTNKQKTAVAKAVKVAIAKATGLDFAAAGKAHAKASALIEGYKIEAAAAASPLDKAKIKAAAEKMVKSGSAKDLDSLITRLPDNTPYDVLPVLAKARFGIDLKTDPDATDAMANTKTGKRMLKMLAMVPDDVVDNPSLKTVERREPGKNGGFYRSSEDLVVMNGRPGQSNQGFGSGIADQLPGDVDPNCKPTNETAVDYFDFATLHEVGHSVDDNLRFMASREGDAAYGGWKKYGGSVDPIAKAVADWSGYNTTKEQRAAVLGLILGRKVEWPTAPAGKEAEWRKAKTKVTDWFALATNGRIWWQQSNVDKITINGVVYQEAYKNDWVSYDAKARKQAITGYQFRAPGEWFAELYASHKIGKLKKAHPATKWLSAIKI